jgi:hypothetical protein
MTLTSQLRDPSSPLARLFAVELPDLDALLRSYRSAVPERPATIRPRAPSGEQPPWATIGTAIDLRLRLALTSDPSEDEALPRGVALSAYLTDAAHPGGPPAATAADVEAAGWALLDLLDQLTDAYMPCARSRPVPLSPAAEAQLCRAVYLAAEYVEVYRSGRPGLVLADAGEDGPITLAALLAAVPRYVVDDLTAMVTGADTGLSQVRAAVSSADVIAGPTFAGSDAVGHADGDWIARGLLVDVKATVHPDRRRTSSPDTRCSTGTTGTGSTGSVGTWPGRVCSRRGGSTSTWLSSAPGARPRTCAASPPTSSVGTDRPRRPVPG